MSATRDVNMIARNTMQTSFKNKPNLILKGVTFDAPHLEKFISRPLTASTRPPSHRYTHYNVTSRTTTKKENIDTVYTNEEMQDISHLK